MEIQNKIGEQVFDKLRSKFQQITLGDVDGESTQNPSDAAFFNFNYIDNQGHNHGNITVSLIDGAMKIYYSKNISSDLEGSELTEWYKFLQDMRKTAMSNLYRFDTHDISKSALDISDIQATVARNSMNESLNEGMYGSTKSSYEECGPAKIIVRHNQRIDPEVRGARSRKIESIFVETDEGERFKMPFNSVPGARAMARHVGNGGRPFDDIGESITTMVKEIASLRPFIARNRNAVFEDETTMEMIEAAKEYYNETRKTLGRVKGKRGYKNYVESFESSEELELNEDEAEALKDRFTKKRFSDKMEAAMPVVHKAYNRKNMTPQKPKRPLEEFEEWAEEASAFSTKSIPGPSGGRWADYYAQNAGLDDNDMQQISDIVNDRAEFEYGSPLFDKLYDWYSGSGEMPYGVQTGDDDTPDTWILDRLFTDFEELIEEGITEAEELCSEECCGKPISQCHCGPECPHCDCHEKNKANKEQVDEVKSGPFNSKVIGRRAKVYGQPEFGDVKYNGEEGEIVGAEREHTFSQMVPFKVVYKLQMDDGNRIYMRRENVRPIKQQAKEVTEGTWAIPDTPEKMNKLRELLSNPLPYGHKGENASQAIYGLFGDDDLFDEIYDMAKRFGPEEDAVPFIKDWIKDNAPEYARGLTEGMMLESEELTDDITSMLINRIARYVPEVFTQHGPEHVYNVVRDNVAWITDDWPEDEGFGSSDSYGAWKATAEDLGIDLDEYMKKVNRYMRGEVDESRGRAPQERMHKGDVVLPKATYSDYLEVYKTSAIGGTDTDDDAKRMVKALAKKGKNADEKAAKGALKRMAEQEAKTGMHMSESLAQLMRDAGITK